MFAVTWADVGLVVAGAVAASLGSLVNSIFTNRHARAMESDRRKHESEAEDERLMRANRSELADLYASFLAGATRVVRETLDRAEQKAPLDPALRAEFEAVYAPGYKLRVIAPKSVEPWVDVVIAQVDAIRALHYRATAMGIPVMPHDRETAWEMFVERVEQFNEAARRTQEE